MPYTPILATLGYVLSPESKQVLMIHRDQNPNDYHFGKYNGLGGKLDPEEDIVSGMKREIREESGIECDVLQLCGTISWPGFGKRGEDWFGFIFRIEKWHGSVLKSNPEGSLVWMEIDQIMNLNLWEGDRYFLPLVFTEDRKPFHGVMPYRDGKPIGWSVSIL
jgi:8-oxo-dGTP diphosphatase